MYSFASYHNDFESPVISMEIVSTKEDCLTGLSSYAFKRTNTTIKRIFSSILYRLAFSKQLKLFPRDFIFPIKHEEICDKNPQCFWSSGIMLDGIIMNLFSDITKQTTDSLNKDLFSKIQDDIIYLYKGSLQDY